MFGFINLNKPLGLTSHDCVYKVRRLLKLKKVGHGGTLDPLATGVLPIAVGKATRLLQFLPETKAYQARIRLGVVTTTDDLEGEVIATESTNHLTKEEIIRALAQFQGEITQIPPIYSAIKKDGKKLYELARKGIDVEVPPRIVTINEVKILDFIGGDFLEIDVAIDCGAGTYIRAIARDLGKALGVGGTLASLIRTKSCGMTLDKSFSFEDLEARLQQNQCIFLEPAEALVHLPAINLDFQETNRWLHGQTIPVSDPKIVKNTDLPDSNPIYYRTHKQENHDFLGISIINQNKGITLAKPKIVCINCD